jgi:very-short-patch-repair endonuclease
MFKKRFNVAASRARDQMWVVYSIDIGDLKSSDLRRRLIEHALSPQALAARVEAAFSIAESEFEKEVLRRLITAGYRVQPQYKIGPYRIDIMVGDRSRRLAVECDGDQYHTIAELEQDMDRQSQLERAGLTFHRIRGSAYYRNADREFEGLVQHLSDLGIEPASTVESAPEMTELHSRVVTRAKEIRGFEAVVGVEPAAAEPVTPQPGTVSTMQSIEIFPDAPSRLTEDGTAPPVDDAPRQTDFRKCLPRGDSVSLFIRPHENGNHDVFALLTREGIDSGRIIDKRHQGGVLWVIGDDSQMETFEALAAYGHHFFFAPEGGRATRHRPAWWMRSSGGN